MQYLTGTAVEVEVLADKACQKSAVTEYRLQNRLARTTG
jgi:hypothetical protein